LHEGGEVPRRQGMGCDAAREDRGRQAGDHLGRRNHEEQTGYDRDTRGDPDQGKQEHDHTEGAPVQIGHEPAQSEMNLRRLIVQPLQHNGGTG